MANCSDYISADDLKTGKQAILHIEHVAKSEDASGNPADIVTDVIRGESVTNPTLNGFFSSIGFKPTDGSFEVGGTIYHRWEVLLYQADGQYYQWMGPLPKVVPVGSTPATTGGVDATHWVNQSDLTLRNQLITENAGLLVDDSNIKVKRTELGSIIRTQHFKNKDVLNIKDFGCIGDGNDHPLSEIFSTLTAAQMVYPFVTSLSQTQDYAGWQSAINAAKPLNAGVFQPSGNYIVNSTVIADYAPSLYGEGGQGLRDVSSTAHSPSPVRGTTFHSKVTSGRLLSIAPDKFCFGLTLRDFAIWGVQGQCDTGLYLHNVGWTGIVSGLGIQHFPNHGLEIGYIQDTYFNNCSVLQCGNSTKYAVSCAFDSNYVYFNGCHFELTAYLLKLTTAWFWSWSQCHFEVARPAGDGITDNDRFFYSTAAIDLGNAHQLSFSQNTFIPVDVAYLATKLSVARDAVPYFMTGAGDYISFSGDTWLAPEGSIDVGYFTSTNVSFTGCKFISTSPSRMALFVQNGEISNCSLGILVTADTSKLYGLQVQSGCVSGCNIGFIGTPGTTKRTAGFIAGGAATFVGNEYPNSVIVNKYLDNAATVHGFDGKTPTYVNITASGDIDLTNYHPATQLRVSANSITITHIYGAPMGRDVIVSTTGTGTIINFSSDNLLTQGAVNFSLGQYRTTLFKGMSTGIPVLQQIG